MPTGSKGLINQLSNMVAPQVSGHGNTKSTWTIVTNKKNKRKAQELFKKEDFPPLPEPSSAIMDTSSYKANVHPPTRVKLQKNVIKITPDIDMSKLKTSREKNLKTNEDDKSTVSSSTSESIYEKGKNKDKKNPEEVTKDSQESMDLANWIKAQLGTKASNVKLTSRLESHPCVVTVEEMAAASPF